jgi:hypothetical protein
MKGEIREIGTKKELLELILDYWDLHGSYWRDDRVAWEY